MGVLVKVAIGAAAVIAGGGLAYLAFWVLAVENNRH